MEGLANCLYPFVSSQKWFIHWPIRFVEYLYVAHIFSLCTARFREVDLPFMAFSTIKKEALLLRVVPLYLHGKHLHVKCWKIHVRVHVLYIIPWFSVTCWNYAQSWVQMYIYIGSCPDAPSTYFIWRLLWVRAWLVRQREPPQCPVPYRATQTKVRAAKVSIN